MGLRAQYTDNTNSDLAKIRRHLTNRKLGTELCARLFSDGSLRIMAIGTRKIIPLDAFKKAVSDIVCDAEVDVAETRFRSTKEEWWSGVVYRTRTAVLTIA